MTQTSQNGWPVPPTISVVDWKIADGVVLPLLDNAVGWSLAHLALWFHDTVEPLTGKVHDDWGFDPEARNIRGGASDLSNHDSATAMDLNATKHPRGGLGLDGFVFDDISRIHKRLAWMHRHATNGQQAPGSDSNVGDWVWRWGFDYHNSPVDGMHFEYNRTVGAFAGRFVASVRDREYGRKLTELNPHFFGSRMT